MLFHFFTLLSAVPSLTLCFPYIGSELHALFYISAEPENTFHFFTFHLFTCLLFKVPALVYLWGHGMGMLGLVPCEVFCICGCGVGPQLLWAKRWEMGEPATHATHIQSTQHHTTLSFDHNTMLKALLQHWKARCGGGVPRLDSPRRNGPHVIVHAITLCG